ncbi:MAG: DUF222 domain-containing protein, partial [Sporichthyaceae bacterium]
VRTNPAVNADAMLALARCALEHLHTVNPAGTPAHTVNISVDLPDLLAHDQDPDNGDTAGTARLENGPGIHPETLRRILCDSAAVIVAHHRAGKPGTSMDVGRRTRTVPPRLRRALVLRDGGCGAPGCTATKFLHAHHVIHWSKGGPTALWNLILLCTAHHLVHEGGFTVEADGHGAFAFHAPDATAIPHLPHQSGGNPATVAGMHPATIGPWTATPRWYGERLDLPYAVNVLLLAEEHAARQLENASAEAPGPTGADLN